jgi:hypothetical protein
MATFWTRMSLVGIVALIVPVFAVPVRALSQPCLCAKIDKPGLD